MAELTAAQVNALVTRPDLLAAEAQIVSDSGRNWRGRLADLGDYGTRGGSALDRRTIVEAMASLELSTSPDAKGSNPQTGGRP